MMTTTIRRSGNARIKGAAAIAAIAMLGGLLAGCSSDDNGDAEATPTPEATATEETPPTGELATFTRTDISDSGANFVLIENPCGGPRLTFAADSGIEVLTEVDGDCEFAFLDFNDSGSLDPAEDWRLPARERAEALAPQLTIEQIAGLMLFSPHAQHGDGFTEEQQEWISENFMRNVLNSGPSDTNSIVPWVNAMQAYAQGARNADEPWIPVNFASDPRSAAGATLYNAPGAISRWPSSTGLAATFNIDWMTAFAEAASAEYRALGITTALSPQIDLATDPRWARVDDTMGEDATWAGELTAAYVRGFQYEPGTTEWGPNSVATMIKHLGGDGANEGGRIAHQPTGAYAVHPGGGFETRMSVFYAGLESAGMMSGFPIMLDGEGHPLFGYELSGSFDPGLMNMLRNEWNWEGVLVTDWWVTRDHDTWMFTGHGTQDMTIPERVLLQLFNGTDQFGGDSDMGPINEAFDLWQAAYEAGEFPIDAETRWQETGVRVLDMYFKLGLFENPFLVLEESLAIVGSDDKQAMGNQAQLESVIMLRNVDGTISPSTLADFADLTVYVPWTKTVSHPGPWGAGGDVSNQMTLEMEILEQFFANVITDELVWETTIVEAEDEDGEDEEIETLVDIIAPDLSEVDIVLVGMRSPFNGGQFGFAGFDPINEVYIPISLQWGPYVADGPYVRRTSISGHLQADGTRENRSYFGNAARISNRADIEAFDRAVAAVAATGRDIPVITILQAQQPVVPTEIYEDSDAIVVGFGISQQALLEIALGLHEPMGRLPITFPADMDAVERQYEDVADTDPFIDSHGNAWGFGFGLNFSGPIG